MFSSVRTLDPRFYLMLLGLVVVSVMGVVGTFLGFFATHKRKGPPRKVLPREEAPELHALVEETAKVANSRNVGRVEVELEPNVHVREEGSPLGSLFKGGTRVLCVGPAPPSPATPHTRGSVVSCQSCSLLQRLNRDDRQATRESSTPGADVDFPRCPLTSTAAH